MEEPDPAGVALKLATLRERPLRDRAKTRLAALEAARGRLAALAPVLRQQLERPLGDCDRRLAGRLAGALADCSPRELAEALEGLLAVELTAPGELEGLIERLGGRLGLLEELEVELGGTLWRLAEGRPAARRELALVDVSRLEWNLRERQAERLMRWRLAEAADEADHVKTAGGGLQPTWEADEAEQAVREALTWARKEIWWYLEPFGPFSPEWERWVRAAVHASDAQDDLEAARREAERWEKPRHEHQQPPRPAVAATPAPAAAPQPAAPPPVPARVLPPPPSSPPRGSRRPRKRPAPLYRGLLPLMGAREVLLAVAYAVGWLLAAATVTAPAVYAAAIGQWWFTAVYGGYLAVIGGYSALLHLPALPHLLEGASRCAARLRCWHGECA